MKKINLNKILRYSIPLIPVLGFLIVLIFMKPSSWLNKDENKDYDCPLGNDWIFWFGMLIQGVSLCLLPF